LLCKLSKSGENLICTAMGQMNWLARHCHRVSKSALTITDLGGCKKIQVVHLAEALPYRPKMMTGTDRVFKSARKIVCVFFF
jgi:magnesium chelatase family protein